MKLTGPPYETQIKELIEKWLKAHSIILSSRQGSNIDVVDFEFAWRGCRVGVELKGHSTSSHNLTKVMDQVKRYSGYVDFLIVITHSSGLRIQIERVLSVTSKDLQKRILLFRLQDIDKILLELGDKIEILGPKDPFGWDKNIEKRRK